VQIYTKPAAKKSYMQAKAAKHTGLLQKYYTPQNKPYLIYKGKHSLPAGCGK